MFLFIFFGVVYVFVGDLWYFRVVFWGKGRRFSVGRDMRVVKGSWVFVEIKIRVFVGEDYNKCC